MTRPNMPRPIPQQDPEPAPARIVFADGTPMPEGADKLVSMALRFVIQPEVFGMYQEYVISQNTLGPEADQMLRSIAPLTRQTLIFVGYCFDLAIRERHPSSES